MLLLPCCWCKAAALMNFADKQGCPQTCTLQLCVCRSYNAQFIRPWHNMHISGDWHFAVSTMCNSCTYTSTCCWSSTKQMCCAKLIIHKRQGLWLFTYCWVNHTQVGIETILTSEARQLRKWDSSGRLNQVCHGTFMQPAGYCTPGTCSRCAAEQHYTAIFSFLQWQSIIQDSLAARHGLLLEVDAAADKMLQASTWPSSF